MVNQMDRQVGAGGDLDPEMPEWQKIAAAVRPKLKELPRSGRLRAISAIARTHGINSPDTLRRYVAAADFLDRFHQAVGAAAPRFPPDTSVSAIELIARWFAYDASSAINAAAKLARGGYTVLELRSDERSARLAHKGTRTGRSGAHLLRQRLAHKIEDLIARGACTQYAPNLPRQYEPKKIDFFFQSVVDPSDRIAVAIFGPFSDERQYFYKEEDFLVRILGLSRCFHSVVGIVPNHKEWGIDFEAWLDHYSDAAITFHYLNLETLEIHSPRSVHGAR